MEIKIEYNRPVQQDAYDFENTAIERTVNEIKSQLDSLAGQFESQGIELTFIYNRDEDISLLIASGASEALLEAIRERLSNSDISVKNMLLG